MNGNRLGCLSSSAIVASIITLLVIAGFGLFSGSAFFTAGSLNAQPGDTLAGVNSHAAIGNDCAKCHPAPWNVQTQGDLCMVCHQDIVEQLAQPASLHSLMLKEQKIACHACHPDHRGPTAPLTELRSGNFPHEGTGYSLRSHQNRADGQAFICADCHGTEITSFDPAICSTCHEQDDAAFVAKHTQDYGATCLACHDGRESLGKLYDHSLVAFKLEGKHASVICADCHAGARVAADFKNAPSECVDCHQGDDEHKGEFGQDCGSCHKVSGWEPATFDHNKSAFKLEGEHAEVRCAECHINNVFKGTASTCFACHQKDDEHDGKFGQDCAACHTPTDWDSATFDHNKSAFKLDGAHANVECQKCHVNNVYKGTASTCFACHQKDDEHKGKFGQDCAICHTPSDWDSVIFDHNQSAFKLDGAHASVECQKCHVNNVFKGTPRECSGCHGDPVFHRGMFSGSTCSQCHNNRVWSPAIYNGSHPGISDDDGGRGVNHGGRGCRSCHTENLNTATCTECHKNNNPGDGDGGGDDD